LLERGDASLRRAFGIFMHRASSAENWLARKIYRKYERILEAEISEKPLPEHVAIIMDGNRRYARLSRLSIAESYELGAKKTEEVIEWCFDLGIKQLTIYAFSAENFRRSDEEKAVLFNLICRKFYEIEKNKKIHEHEVRVKAIGNLKMLPEHVIDAIKRAERATEKYNRFKLFIAVAYSGRMEILDAARRIAEKVRRGEISPEEIDEDLISSHLYHNDGGGVRNTNGGGRERSEVKTSVDLIIRTGGEKRLSNFVPWQSLGNECAAYFCAPFWPCFRRIDLLRAIRTYQQREEERKMTEVGRILKVMRCFL